jgi:AcrR family transcriptional regulator
MRQKTITRGKIIEATLRVVRKEGLVGATTRAIVQAVPCAEGTLYLYFKHRTELILALIEESASGFVEHLIRLSRLVGQKTVEDNLVMIVRQAARFQEDALTLFCGVISDPELLKAQQEIMRKARKGPHLSRIAIARYLDAEKRHGRVHQKLDPNLTAALLLRASFGRVFEERFSGVSLGAANARYIKALITSLLSAPADDHGLGNGNCLAPR